MYCHVHIILEVWYDFKCTGSQIDWCTGNWYFWVKYDFGQKCYATQVCPILDSNSWPPDHDSTFHVIEMPALTTRPSVTSKNKCSLLPHYRGGLRWFQMHGLSDRLMHWQLMFLVQVHVWLRTEGLHTPSLTQSGSNSWPPDHDSTLHVTKTLTLTTWPSVISARRHLPLHCL